jgi:Zn-dependent protease
VKYGLFFVFKIPALATALTALVSVGAYALLFPWQVAAGIVALLFVHEMGHVIEIRRQGLVATAPIFIPFMGAAVFMRTHAQSPVRQAEIGIAGPIAGTIGALGALVLYRYTGVSIFLVWAYFGFLINLFNLVPVTPLDGGRVLSLLSKWFNVAGLVVAAGLLLYEISVGTTVSPVLFLVLIFGAFSTFQRFRSTVLNPAYYAVDARTKLTIGLLYLGLLLALGLGMLNTSAVLRTG